MKEKPTCYSAGEKKFMDFFGNFKFKLFLPLLKLLKKLNITANNITFLGMVFGILAGIALFFHYFLAGIILLLIHVFLDGVDGALASYSKSASLQGGIFDNLADLISLFFFTIGLLGVSLINPVLSVWFIFVYVLIVAFSLLRNNFKKPYKIMLRPRYWFYIVFIIYFIFNFNIMNFALFVFNIVMSITFITGMIISLRCLKDVK